ncbi:MAG: tyrosine-type recombinase/integrase [Gammaproteobacteria bacterium]|nr:tyrosine-type recombinase/integrase [Gammaproteobacteria bacterium]
MSFVAVHPDTFPLNAATVLLALGPRRVVVVLIRLLADRIENGGAPPPLDIELAISRLPKTRFAATTRKAYRGALRRLREWLEGRPATDALLAEYLGVLYDRDLSPPSARLVVAGVGFAAKECARAGLRCSDPVGPRTRERLDRFCREGAGRSRGQVRGLTWEEADEMCELAEAKDDPAGPRDAALIGVASHALLRVAEVSGLRAGDVWFEPDGSARALVRRSKTDQRGEGAVLYVGEEAADRLRAWIGAAGIQAGPLFRALERDGRVSDRPLGPDSVRAAIKRRAKEAGIEGRVSGHSLRVGAAQSLAERGVSIAEMQREGRWKDAAMPGYYVRGQEASRGAVARLRSGRRSGAGRRSKKHLRRPERRW